LEVDQKLPLTFQTQHQLCACLLVSFIAKSKVQAEPRKNPIRPHKKRHLDIISLVEKVPKTKVDSHVLLSLVHVDGIDQNRNITSHPCITRIFIFSN